MRIKHNTCQAEITPCHCHLSLFAFETYTFPIQSEMHLAYQTHDKEIFLHRHKVTQFSISFKITLFHFTKIRNTQTELCVFKISINIKDMKN